MTCAKCGADIADKALICYRCGAATSPVSTGPLAARRSSAAVRRLPVLVGLLLLVAAGLFLGQASGDAVPRWAGWIVTAVATGLLLWRILRRRG